MRAAPPLGVVWRRQRRRAWWRRFGHRLGQAALHFGIQRSSPHTHLVFLPRPVEKRQDEKISGVGDRKLMPSQPGEGEL